MTFKSFLGNVFYLESRPGLWVGRFIWPGWRRQFWGHFRHLSLGYVGITRIVRLLNLRALRVYRFFFWFVGDGFLLHSTKYNTPSV